MSSLNGIHSYLRWRNPAIYYTGIRMDIQPAYAINPLGGMDPPSGNVSPQPFSLCL